MLTSFGFFWTGRCSCRNSNFSPEWFFCHQRTWQNNQRNRGTWEVSILVLGWPFDNIMQDCTNTLSKNLSAFRTVLILLIHTCIHGVHGHSDCLMFVRSWVKLPSRSQIFSWWTSYCSQTLVCLLLILNFLHIQKKLPITMHCKINVFNKNLCWNGDVIIAVVITVLTLYCRAQSLYSALRALVRPGVNF